MCLRQSQSRNCLVYEKLLSLSLSEQISREELNVKWVEFDCRPWQ